MGQCGYLHFDHVFHFGIFAMGAVSRHQLYLLVFPLYSYSLVCMLLTITGTLSAPEIDVLDFLRQFVTERCSRDDLT